MTGTFQRLSLVLLVSAAASFAVWKFGEGSAADKLAFTTVVGSFANPPLFVSGDGTHASPWALRTFASDSRPDRRQAPVIVSLGDDAQRFFQASPPAPIDLAVVLSNFQRLGAKKAATAAVLAWEEPDPIGFIALEKALGRFESVVTAAPLARGSAGSSMPPPFRRASIPFSSIRGDGSAIPVVNRIPVPGVVLGGETAAAGFSVLETENDPRFLPLMARWEDRVVFAFPLLTVLQRLGLPPEGMEIKPGEYLKLSPEGPIVPIDIYGRLTTPLKPIAAYAEIQAEALIDGGDELFPKKAPDPVILRDDRSTAEGATRDFSKYLSASIAAIASDHGMAPVTAYPRLAREWEIGILSLAVLVLTIVCGRRGAACYVACGVLGGVFLAAQWLGAGMASVWLPGIPALAAVIPGVVIARLTQGRPVRTTEITTNAVEGSPVQADIPVATPDVTVAIVQQPAEVVPLKVPTKKAVNPVPNKPVSKASAKKTTPKKSGGSKSSRSKKSPPKP